VQKLFLLLVMAAVLVVGLAALGGTLPEGNPLRDATEGLRAMGSAIADGFGGGYRPMTGG
jgi:hypothetical protein